MLKRDFHVGKKKNPNMLGLESNFYLQMSMHDSL